MKDRKWLYLVPVIIVIVDQLIKLFIPTESIVFKSNVINITYVENTGGAFNILKNSIFWISIFNIVVIGIIFKLLKERINQLGLKEIIPLCMILGGVVGNLIDRLFRRYVIDYIEIALFTFPIFNIADIFIVIGTIVISIVMIENIIKEKC